LLNIGLVGSLACGVEQHPDWVEEGSNSQDPSDSSDDPSSSSADGGSENTAGEVDGGDGDAEGGDGDAGDGDAGDGDTEYAAWQFNTGIRLNTTLTGAGVSDDVDGFPVLLHINGMNKPSDAFFMSETKPGGADLRFSASPDTTVPLSYEIEAWNPQGQNALIWVRVDTVLGDTNAEQIRMYWGNDQANSQSDGSAVFRAAEGFVGVWHLHDNAPVPLVEDATGNHPGQWQMTTSQAQTQAGIIAGGARFDGDIEYINVADHPDFDPEDGITLSAWAWSQNMGGSWRNVISKGRDNQDDGYWIGIWRDFQDPCVWFMRAGQGISDLVGCKFGQWEFVTLTAPQGGTARMYVDGLEVGDAQAPPGHPLNGNEDIGIGTAHGINETFIGFLDEVRWSSRVRSPGWVKLSYENQRLMQTLVEY
jgi:hypothetical protein